MKDMKKKKKVYWTKYKNTKSINNIITKLNNIQHQLKGPSIL